jgi:hypothetical protein
MTSAEVSELTEQIDINALREYRDAVGRRTRDVLGVMDLEGGCRRACSLGGPASACSAGWR